MELRTWNLQQGDGVMKSSTSHLKTKRRKVLSLPCLKTIKACLHMSNAEQSSSLIWLLHTAPGLSHLKILRIDTPCENEGEPWTTEGSTSCECLENSPNYLELTEYRGGAAEQVFIKAVLRHERKLNKVKIKAHATLPQIRQKADVQLFRNCPCASTMCCITLV